MGMQVSVVYYFALTKMHIWRMLWYIALALTLAVGYKYAVYSQLMKWQKVSYQETVTKTRIVIVYFTNPYRYWRRGFNEKTHTL